jgi:hypothetical protein
MTSKSISKVRSFRASHDEWETWGRASGSESLNSWARRVLNDAARVAAFELSGEKAQKKERAQMREAIRPGFGVNDLSGYRPDPK